MSLQTVYNRAISNTYEAWNGLKWSRYRYGDLVKAKGRVPRIYNDVGYIDVHGGGDSVSYHYWMADHLGSVHAVVDVDNRVEQAHDYTVSGIPATRLGQTVDNVLYTTAI